MVLNAAQKPSNVSLIPKTVTDNGNTLTLADVQWANDGTYYTATAKYTGTATSRYATGYTATANYTGQIAKADCNMITLYTCVSDHPEYRWCVRGVELAA